MTTIEQVADMLRKTPKASEIETLQKARDFKKAHAEVTKKIGKVSEEKAWALLALLRPFY